MTKGFSASVPRGDLYHREPPDERPISFVFDVTLEPGEELPVYVSDHCADFLAPDDTRMLPTDFIYRGDPDLWILAKHSNASGRMVAAVDLPCDTFGPRCPTAVRWPEFWHGCLILWLINRSDARRRFVARLVAVLIPKQGAFR